MVKTPTMALGYETRNIYHQSYQEEEEEKEEANLATLQRCPMKFQRSVLLGRVRWNCWSRNPNRMRDL